MHGRGLAQHGIGQRAGDVPRLGVAELPGPRRTGQLARGAGTPVITLAVAPGKLLRHIA
ncbi:Uncharacterised protein [Mycobacterium tuberculosis]|uniref:Uncharacterized protein n=1 Tax=Mycobacterium tuberculosis TaxID=1773 RepID=A0A655ATJ4_MYCTX|nr:Uncharacterised protein [Mycobacterium tuberculosis]COW34954.1 Uncharacterised protein [Mycobacterium tuberculosis]